MSKLLLACTPLFGHVSPVRSVAADLAARGHDVTFLTGAAFKDDVLAAGARFVPFHGAADVRLEDLAVERDRHAPGPDQLNFDMHRVFIDPVPVQHELIQRELAAVDGEPVVLITDVFCLGSWPIALGAPGTRPAGTIGIGITVYPATSAEAPPPGLGLSLDTSQAGRAGIAEANASLRGLFSPAQAHLEQVLGSLGTSQPIPFFLDGLAGITDRTLLQAPAGSSTPGPTRPPGCASSAPSPRHRPRTTSNCPPGGRTWSRPTGSWSYPRAHSPTVTPLPCSLRRCVPWPTPTPWSS